MKTAFILYHINFEKTEKNRWKRKKKEKEPYFDFILRSNWSWMPVAYNIEYTRFIWHSRA